MLIDPREAEKVAPIWDNLWRYADSRRTLQSRSKILNAPNSPMHLASQMPHINVSVFLRWVFNLSQSQADESEMKGKRNRLRIDLMLRLNHTYLLLSGSIITYTSAPICKPQFIDLFLPNKKQLSHKLGLWLSRKNNLLVSLNLYYHRTPISMSTKL